MRIRKVSYIMARPSRRRATSSAPLIRLSGHWLKAHGFDIGAGYTLTKENGAIVLKPAAVAA